jgi:hypothetical protein
VHQLSTWYHPSGQLAAHEVSEYYVGLLLDGLQLEPPAENVERTGHVERAS